MTNQKVQESVPAGRKQINDLEWFFWRNYFRHQESSQTYSSQVSTGWTKCLLPFSNVTSHWSLEANIPYTSVLWCRESPVFLWSIVMPGWPSRTFCTASVSIGLTTTDCHWPDHCSNAVAQTTTPGALNEEIKEQNDFFLILVGTKKLRKSMAMTHHWWIPHDNRTRLKWKHSRKFNLH